MHTPPAVLRVRASRVFDPESGHKPVTCILGEGPPCGVSWMSIGPDEPIASAVLPGQLQPGVSPLRPKPGLLNQAGVLPPEIFYRCEDMIQTPKENDPQDHALVSRDLSCNLTPIPTLCTSFLLLHPQGFTNTPLTPLPLPYHCWLNQFK